MSEKPTCMSCHGTGQKEDGRGYAGGASDDGITCFDCRGSGTDTTDFELGGDWCPHCGADWKDDHDEDCRIRLSEARALLKKAESSSS